MLLGLVCSDAVESNRSEVPLSTAVMRHCVPGRAIKANDSGGGGNHGGASGGFGDGGITSSQISCTRHKKARSFQLSIPSL